MTKNMEDTCKTASFILKNPTIRITRTIFATKKVVHVLQQKKFNLFRAIVWNCIQIKSKETQQQQKKKHFYKMLWCSTTLVKIYRQRICFGRVLKCWSEKILTVKIFRTTVRIASEFLLTPFQFFPTHNLNYKNACFVIYKTNGLCISSACYWIIKTE